MMRSRKNFIKPPKAMAGAEVACGLYGVRYAELLYACRNAHLIGDTELLKTLSRLLDGPAGELYSVLAGRDYADGSKIVGLFPYLSDGFKARALGLIANSQSEPRIQHRLRQEAYALALRTGDMVTAAFVQMDIAVTKSQAGDHPGALSVLSAARGAIIQSCRSFPQTGHFYANSVAVELCEGGQLELAEQFSRYALSSQFAWRHPGMLETWAEIQAKKVPKESPIVLISLPLEKVVRMRLPTQVNRIPTNPCEPGEVIDLEERRQAKMEAVQGSATVAAIRKLAEMTNDAYSLTDDPKLLILAEDVTAFYARRKGELFGEDNGMSEHEPTA